MTARRPGNHTAQIGSAASKVSTTFSRRVLGVALTLYGLLHLLFALL